MAALRPAGLGVVTICAMLVGALAAAPGQAATSAGGSGVWPAAVRAAGVTKVSSAPVSTAHDAVLPAGKSWTVTLITGDVVTVRSVPGRPPLVAVRPGPGRTHVIFSKFVDSLGHVLVLPHDVAPLVGRVLDPALFDVTTLILNGDDDAHRSFLPLIVQGGAADGGASLAVPAVLHRVATLSSIGAVAVAEPKAAAPRLGAVLAATASPRLCARSGRSAASGGIRHIWLDRTVRVADGSVAATKAVLDHNLVQIGAPVAWRAGDTGRGVKIAVLDTGVGASFPDLRGQIVASKNFTGLDVNNVLDRNGHGTFVAALAAGTGRAANGERRGVAFGAKLVIGKVLGDDGSGLESWAIAGMQWAATRAKIINLSFGTPGASEQTDPMAIAVNRLTARYHVLFVAAAGDSGPSDNSILSPGEASAALTVGAVDGRDRLAFFSSRGPNLGNFAIIKPEITAPGVDIVGARAAGTAASTILDAHYIIASGTSVSAPQVAGAAAILAALHPGWSPARLKADLVSTAHRATGGDFFQVGGGRVDIAAAITDPVVADQAVANLGTVPDGMARTVSDQLSWTNNGSRAATIKLSVTLTEHFAHRAPRGAIGLTASVLRIAAGRAGTVTLVARPSLLASHPGLYEGQVIARDGTRIIRTPVSLYVRPPMHTLTVRATPLPGTLPNKSFSFFLVVSVSDPDLFPFVEPGCSGHNSVRVPAGHYWVIGQVDDNSNPKFTRSAMTGQPDVIVNRDTTVTLDGAHAVPVTASVQGRRTQTAGVAVHVERGYAGVVSGFDTFAFPPIPSAPVIFAQPTGTARIGTFRVSSNFRLSSLPSGHASFVYDLYHVLGDRIPTSASYVVTPAEQAQLATVHVRFYAIGGNTAPINETRYGLTPGGFLVLNYNGNPAGGTVRTDYLTAGPGISYLQDIAPPFVINGKDQTGSWAIEQPGFRRYQPASQHVFSWGRQPFTPGPYSATIPSISACTPVDTTRSRGNIEVDLLDLQDLPDGFDCLGFLGYTQPPWDVSTMRLYRGTRLIGTRHNSFADFPVADRSARFRLTYADSTAKLLTVSTRTRTTWTFNSPVPAGLGLARIPLLLVRYALPLSLLNQQDGTTAVLTVARVAGTPRAKVTGLRLWTSADGGHTWQPAPVRPLGGGRFAATLPHVAAGKAVSLRVEAADAGGSTIEQTIITAYRG